MHSGSTFGAKTSHGQTRTHKIHHGPDLREATTFPLIIYSMPLHDAHIQMAFCPKIPKWESQNSQSWNSHNFGAHDFVCKPSIKMRSKAKLQPSLRALQSYVAHHLHTRKSNQFSTFSGQESNCQFDFRPFFWP